MNPDSVEDSIQKLLSVLFPPFEATAPTLLSQLFLVIERRYRGDALRCLLDFLLPAKQILDTVQQAACAQYCDALFLCEGWPLCLRDRVVVHLAPVDPLILRPGDFYLQVAPFCDQSARILVCSLLEEEGLGVEVVEETPVPETSYPCIFTSDWLKEINHGRHGTPLRRCLLATEQGVVRLPWERVALPDLVERPQRSGSSMASVPPSSPPLPPPLPPPLHHSSEQRPFRPSKEPRPDPSSHPQALSVQTRIRPAKHGIAVSLCLVDAGAASSPRPAEAKETDPEPVGWVSSNTWDSRFTGPGVRRCPSGSSPHGAVPRDPGPHRDVVSGVGSAERAAAEGEYIDVVRATMLFSKAQALKEEQRRADGRMHPQVDAQRRAQAHAHTLWLPHTPQTRSDPVCASFAPDAEISRHHSPPLHPGPPDPSQCVRTVRFSEKPCTPCMQRRRGGPGPEAPETRCRYRDSYQAALQNPVTFGQERRRADVLAAVQEDEDFSDGRRPSDDPRCDARGGAWRDPLPVYVSGGVCEESGETNAVAHWKGGDSNRVEQPLRENGYAQSSVPVNGSHFQPLSAKHQGLRFSSGDTSGSNVTLRPQERVPDRTGPSGTCADFSESPAVTPNRPESSASDGRCSSLSTAVVDTSERCELVIVDGRNVRRRENRGGSGAEVPQLHVVKCKNSTAFRLVSPKISRRKAAAPDVQHQHPSPPSAAEIPRTSHRAPAQPRPDHLPLGSPDPRAHPLYLGVAALTGGRDRTGRAVVELYGDHPGWKSAVTSQEVFHMLLYFHLITRREIREAGMTLVFDARKTSPQPQLYKALMTLQEQNLPVLNSLLLLVDKDSFRPERCPGLQTDTVTSMKALLKQVEASQLSSRLDGSLPHSHCDWLELHQKLFPFVSDLHEASRLLLSAIAKQEEPQRTDSVQAVQQCTMDQRTLMRDVLEDGRLVGLQREGGAMLARLRRESDLKYPHCEGLSDAVDSVSSLYNLMEEQAHVLVQRSNVSLEHLGYLLQLREMEGHFAQIQQWFHAEGERHLLEAESVEDSGERMEQILDSFTRFLIEANDRRHHAMSLVSEAERLQQSGLSYPETGTFGAFVGAFKSDLDDFLCRAKSCGRELQIMVNVCDFCEQATALATECTNYLNQTNTRPDPDPDGPGSALQAFQDRFVQFGPERFQEVKAQADALRGTRGMRVWNAAWLRCQEARQQLQERVQEADEPNPESGSERHYVDVVSTNVQAMSPGGQSLVVQSTPGPRHPQWEGMVDGGKGRTGNIVVEPEEHGDAGATQGSKVTPPSPHRPGKRTEARRRQSSRARRERDAAALSQSHTVGCQWFPWARGPRTRSASQDSGATETAAATAGSATPPEQRVRSPSACSHHGQPSCRILKEAQKFQISRHGSFCSEESCPSERRGGAAAGGGGSGNDKHSSLPIGGRYEGAFGSANPPERTSSALRLQRVLEELVVTEREYVRSLSYILTHYFPLLDRADIPQDLRGKRGVIFGNLEKLYNFHSHYFLPELEECQREPAMVARCFLRHSESFGLYALYSKNKPQSDALILHRRHDIFKRKQQELGDLMDLSSYLLRPIQRISKYSLLLQDMLSLAASYRPKDPIQDSLLESSACAQSVCGPGVFVPDLTGGERERERAEIRAAADLVRFQMRHGNDLLTMDAIRDCDVNLKEQGQLIRQDEFTVFFRKKKCVRRVFLFEHLVLFSKTKKTDVGNDVYVYKQSFKTCDIGMTHNSGVSGLCFEIWFRRRKSEDTYTLKSCSMEVKKAWTTDLERILWDQATHSRELRLQERVFMGIPSKHFMDIQPSDAAICDRAVSRVQPGRIPVACCSHRDLDFPRPHSIGSGSTASTTLSQSSSSSGRGSLPPAGYPGNRSQGLDPGPASGSSPEAVTDNELNNRHLHQHLRRNCEQWKGHHRSLVDSTASSGECINLLSGSEPSCLSAMGAEAADNSSSSFHSHDSKPRPPASRTPSLRRSGSPVVVRKKPDISPKPSHLSQSEILIPKSTEV